MDHSILNKLSQDEINSFVNNPYHYQSIKSINQIIQDNIIEYLNNSKYFIKITSREQFLVLLQAKYKYDEYDTRQLYNSIFSFPFYISESLFVRIGNYVGGKDSRYSVSILTHQIMVQKIDNFWKKKEKIFIGVFPSSVLDRELEIQKLTITDQEVFTETDQIQTSIYNQIVVEIESLIQNSILKCKAELDKNNDGEIDLFDNDFEKLLTKNQKKVVDIDKNYLHKLVKICNYLKTKKVNIQNIFNSLLQLKNPTEIENRIGLLKNQVHTYDLLLFHSINMIGAISDENLITFYEIYESFDKLGIFNSNWENEVSERLNTIGEKLDNLMDSIYQMENNIVNEISNLTYTTQESFSDLKESVSKQLNEIDSSIKFNNLLNGIQTYQLYKINKNTKTNT